MRRILVSSVKGILGVAALGLSGCATPSFFRDSAPKGPLPEDTVVRHESGPNPLLQRERLAPLRPEPEPEPEPIVIVEAEREEEREEPAGAPYTVKKGDSLSWLAKKYGVRFKDLLKANSLDRNAKLFVGQRLILPGVTEEQLAQAAAPTEYVVQKGDCLSKIAQRYGLRVYEIKAANGMKGDRLVAGKKIIIPERGRYASRGGGKAKTPQKVEAAFAVDGDGYYTIKKGDMLSKIAARAKVSVGDLQRWNNLSDPAKIRVGQKIMVRQKIVAPVSAGAAKPAVVASEEPSSVPGGRVPPRRSDFADDVDFFAKIDDIPIVQVYE